MYFPCMWKNIYCQGFKRHIRGECRSTLWNNSNNRSELFIYILYALIKLLFTTRIVWITSSMNTFKETKSLLITELSNGMAFICEHLQLPNPRQRATLFCGWFGSLPSFISITTLSRKYPFLKCVSPPRLLNTNLSFILFTVILITLIFVYL